MKILYVDLQYDYGKKERGINQIGEIGFHQVFKKLGHEVECFYYDSYLNQLPELQNKLLAAADAAQPDLIFFCLYTHQFSVETLQKLKSKYRTMNWFGDDQWRFKSFTSQYAPCFTYSITTDVFSVDKYKKIGVDKVFVSQWAALNLPTQDLNQSNYKYDISFVGGFNPTRHWIIAEFKKAGLDVATFGHGWPQGAISLEKMVEIFQQSKINLNLSNSVSLDIRYLTFRLRNLLTALKSKKISSQLKARNFEIPYYGGFQLTDYVPSLEKYLEVGREVACFSNVDEAVLQARYYLKNDELREGIKTAGMAKARAEHTYLHRFKEIFEHL